MAILFKYNMAIIIKGSGNKKSIPIASLGNKGKKDSFAMHTQFHGRLISVRFFFLHKELFRKSNFFLISKKYKKTYLHLPRNSLYVEMLAHLSVENDIKESFKEQVNYGFLEKTSALTARSRQGTSETPRSPIHNETSKTDEKRKCQFWKYNTRQGLQCTIGWDKRARQVSVDGIKVKARLKMGHPHRGCVQVQFKVDDDYLYLISNCESMGKIDSSHFILLTDESMNKPVTMLTKWF